MPTYLNPYLSFRNTAREAMEFYHSVFGGELLLNTFAEFQASQDPAEQDLIMHGRLETPAGMILMGADTPASMELSAGSAIAVSLSGEDDAELSGYYEKLSASGQATLPLEMAPWGDKFGMCVDAYGVSWMVNIAGAAG